MALCSRLVFYDLTFHIFGQIFYCPILKILLGIAQVSFENKLSLCLIIVRWGSLEHERKNKRLWRPGDDDDVQPVSRKEEWKFLQPEVTSVSFAFGLSVAKRLSRTCNFIAHYSYPTTPTHFYVCNGSLKGSHTHAGSHTFRLSLRAKTEVESPAGFFVVVIKKASEILLLPTFRNLPWLRSRSMGKWRLRIDVKDRPANKNSCSRM